VLFEHVETFYNRKPPRNKEWASECGESAVALVLKEARTITRAAPSLGVSEHPLCSSVAQAHLGAGLFPPSTGKDLAARVRALAAECRRRAEPGPDDEPARGLQRGPSEGLHHHPANRSNTMDIRRVRAALRQQTVACARWSGQRTGRCPRPAHRDDLRRGVLHRALPQFLVVLVPSRRREFLRSTGRRDFARVHRFIAQQSRRVPVRYRMRVKSE
jgi:transposase-like protein